MAPHSSTLAWKIPWTEEPGRLQSMGWLRVGHACIGGNGNPFQCSCLENPKDGGAWWAAIYGVAQSQTRLKRLKSSSSSSNRSDLGRRQWHPTPVLLPGESHGRRSLVGCSPWGHKESDTTEQLHFQAFPGGSDGKASVYQCRRPGFDPWVGKIPWRRKWQPTPLLPRKSHGRRSLVQATAHGVAKSWTRLSDFTFTFIQTGM